MCRADAKPGVVADLVLVWAKLLLLYVCVLACLLIGPSLSLRDNEKTEFDKRLIGASGEVCTKQGRKCISNDTAACVSNRCTCRRGFKGEAEIECVDKRERLCYISGDPHLHGFGRASADVDLPCRFRATRFVTQNVQGTPGHASCGIEVYATNEFLDGRYVVRSVHISVGVSDHALLHHSAFEVYKTFNYNVNDSTIYNYQTRIISRDNIWGSSKGVVDGIVIEPTYDEENNFAMLEIPHCETRIKYRAFDPARPKHQRQLPGVTIQAPRHAAFNGGNAMSFYPQSACGTPADGRLLYRNRAEELGLVDDETAIIYDILTEKPAQDDNANRRRCERVFDTFESTFDGIGDLNACSFLLTKPPVARCLGSKGMRPIDVFNSCLQQRQGLSSGCGRMRRAARECSGERGWTGPSSYTCSRMEGETTPFAEED